MFDEIREQGKLYVDKTDLIYDIVNVKMYKYVFMAKKTYEAFYKLILYVVFSLLKSKVDTEVKSILGRADVAIQTEDDVFVLELKVLSKESEQARADKDVDDALAQIDDKGYAIQYSADGRKVTKCGITISSEARNITHWKTIDEQGNVIDEQTF